MIQSMLALERYIPDFVSDHWPAILCQGQTHHVEILFWLPSSATLQLYHCWLLFCSCVGLCLLSALIL